MSVNRLLTVPGYLEADHDIREAFDRVRRLSSKGMYSQS